MNDIGVRYLFSYSTYCILLCSTDRIPVGFYMDSAEGTTYGSLLFSKCLFKTTYSSLDDKTSAIELFPSEEEERSIQFGEEWSVSMINGNLTMVFTYDSGDKNTATLHKDGEQFQWIAWNSGILKTYKAKETIDYEDIIENWNSNTDSDSD